MIHVSRRDVLKSLGLSALGLAFSQQGLLAAGESPVAATSSLNGWMSDLEQNARQLRKQVISPLQWQEVMDRIYGSTPLASFKEHLNFPRLSRAILEKIPADRQEYFHRIELSRPSGKDLPKGNEPHQVLVTKVAHIRKGESVPPHGHSNMVSAFLCLSGEFDVELYDRMEERDDTMVVRHSDSRRQAGPGTWSSISDYRDNVHWLTAKTDDCFLFTCKMLGVEEHRPLKGRIHIDLRAAKKLGSDTLLAPKIDYARALELY